MLWWFSDSQLLKRKSQALVDCINVTGNESRQYLMLKTNSFANLLAEKVQCHVELENHQANLSQEQLIEHHHLFVTNVGSSFITADDFTVIMGDDNNATVDMSISLNVTGKKGQQYSESGTLTLEWRKDQSDQWGITVIDILSD